MTCPRTFVLHCFNCANVMSIEGNMLLNKNEKEPDLFYIFVDQYNPTTRHNYDLTNSFSSAAYPYTSANSHFLPKYLDGTATYLPFSPSERDCLFMSPYCVTAINDYRVEYDAENCRYRNFSLYPSRLSAVFAFGDFDTCIRAAHCYRWDLSSVRKFKLIQNDLTRVIKVNMEIVSLARMAYRISSITQSEGDLWKAYWSGDGNVAMELPTPDFKRKIHKSGIIWEYLIEGNLVTVE